MLDLALVAALVWLLRGMSRYPVTIADDVLTMRLGALKTISIPLERVAGLRASWDAAALKAPGVRNLAVASWPNVMIGIVPPLRVGRREIVAVAHRLDDPAAFIAAIEALVAARR